MKIIRRNRWGKLRQIHIPQSVVKDGVFALATNALAILAVLLFKQKGQAAFKSQFPMGFDDYTAKATVDRDDLEKLSGFSVNKVTEAVRILRQEGFITQTLRRRDASMKNAAAKQKGGRFMTAEYTLLHPDSKRPMTLVPKENLLYANRVPYFTFPQCLIKEPFQPWSMAQLSSYELRVYFGCVYLAHKAKENEFIAPLTALRRLVGFDVRTVRERLESLEQKNLIFTAEKEKGVTIELNDPYTGEPIIVPEDHEDDPANYYVKDHPLGSLRASLGLSPVEVEKQLRESLVPGEPINRVNENLMIRCPFHDDRNPSCGVWLTQRGFFRCFTCDEKGPFRKLLTKLAGITPAEAIQRIADVKGIKAEYRQPDSAAVAIYEYRTRYGHPVKQVLRFPDGPNGEKIFKQRRYVNGYWRVGTRGVPATLYHAEMLDMADTICITEGEKDADRITQSGLYARTSHPVVGVTSGGANSWQDKFADELRNPRVILMPDADEPGIRYAEQVRASLDKRGIECRAISFGAFGAKDISCYLDTHSLDELIDMIGRDWVRRESQDLQTADVATVLIGEPCDLGEIVI